MPELAVRLKPAADVPGAAVVALRGAIDPKNVQTLHAAVSGAVGKGTRAFIFDLGDTKYLNSAGLGYLVNLADALASRGGRLEIANAQPKVKIVFDLMGVTEFFRLHSSVDAALRALAPKTRLRRRA
jgi:anti-anti-sigma factor